MKQVELFVILRTFALQVNTAASYDGWKVLAEMCDVMAVCNVLARLKYGHQGSITAFASSGSKQMLSLEAQGVRV